MSQRRKKTTFGKKKNLPIYQNTSRGKRGDSSGDRKGVLKGIGKALAGKKSEAPDTPAAASIAPAKSDFDVDKMLKSQGITIPRSIMGDAAPPAAKPAVAPAATPAAKPTAPPAAKPTATPAPTPTAKPAAKPASPSGGQVKGVTAEGMMQEMGFDLPTPVAKNDEEYKQRFYDFLDQTPKEKLKFSDPIPEDPSKSIFDEAFRKSTPPTPSPSTPADEPSDRGLIDGIPTAKRLSEVKSRVDAIRGVADKATAKPPTPTPAPYTPPKDEDELKARRAAFEKMTNTFSSSPYSGDRSFFQKEGFEEAVQAGVPEERARAVAEANLPLNEIYRRQGAANKIDEALTKGEGLKEARQLAIERGVPEEKVDSYIASRDTPEFRKAQQLKQVREAGRRAAEARKTKPKVEIFKETFREENYGREPSDEDLANFYASEAADLRARGFSGLDGTGGLAELAQMQADKYSGVAPGTYTALSKGAKKIAPDSRIIDRYAKLVSEGRMTAEAARRAFGQDMLDKMRYDDPRLFARNEAEYQAAVEEAKRTGAPIPPRPLPGADIDFAALARQVPRKQKPTFIRNGGNYITGFGYTGVYDN